MPDDPILKSLARSIWDQEIRLTLQATSLEKGESLLGIIDACYDEKSNSYWIITESKGEKLEDLLYPKKREPWGVLKLENDPRREFWQQVLLLTESLNSLHEQGLYHRNISPKSVYLDELAGDDYRLFYLGDFSSSVYLYSLTKMTFEYNLQTTHSWLVYCPPELIPNFPKGLLKVSGEKGNADLYSLGMVLAHIILWEDFPNQEINDINMRITQIEETREKICRSKYFILDEERQLLLDLLEISPEDRIESASAVLESISEIISLLSRSDEFDITEKAPVTYYDRSDSTFIGRLVDHLEYDRKNLIQSPNDFLYQEFKGCLIFPSSDSEYNLWVRGNSGTLYGMQPFKLKLQNRVNNSVMKLDVIYSHAHQKRLNTVNNQIPLAKMPNGFCFIKHPHRPQSNSPWPKILSAARKFLSRQEIYAESLEQFIERLFMIVDAERELDASYIFNFEKIKGTPKKTSKSNEKIYTAIKILEDEPLPDFHSIQKRSWRDVLDELSLKGEFTFELGPYDTPYDDYMPGRWWTLEKTQKNGALLLSRSKTDKGLKVPKKGYIRPVSLKLSIPLHKRKVKAIHRFKRNKNLARVFLSPRNSVIQLNKNVIIENPLLDEIMNTIPIFLIQGPPGTGKTWTATEIVKRILIQDPTARILISSKEHEPLDHLVERVAEEVSNLDLNPRPIMIRLMPSEREPYYSTKPVIQKLFGKSVTKEILEASRDWQPQISHWIEEAVKWRDLMDQEAENPGISWQRIVRNCANIIFSTATSQGLQNLQRYAPPFDWVIIEEAGKSYSPELLIPMNLGHRWVLIGDQRQLPPYKIREIEDIIRKNLDSNQLYLELDGSEKGLFEQKMYDELKIFDFLYREYDKLSQGTSRLEKQWRMVPVISDMISKTFYDSRFENQKIGLEEGNPFSSPDYLARNELIWINTTYSGDSSDFSEHTRGKGGYFNIKEAEIIKKILNNIVINPEIPKKSPQIAIITPYNAQKDYLNNSLEKEFARLKELNCNPVCHTVDGFQGRQADLVIISLVRNNRKENVRGALGFLTKEERLNVMLSRSRMRMLIVGCLDHFKNFFSETEVQTIRRIIEYIESKGQIIRADMV